MPFPSQASSDGQCQGGPPVGAGRQGFQPQKTTKRGDEYFTGLLNGRRFLIFKNRATQNDKAPTHTLFWADEQPAQLPNEPAERST
jgi:hypothetical protein